MKKLGCKLKMLSCIVVICILFCILAVQASALTIKSGQVRAHSNGGWATVDQTISGLKPGTTAVVALSGWGINSNYAADLGATTAIYLWDNTANYWATEFPVSSSGTINVRFIGTYSATHPFDYTINYVVIGQ